ncbi:MAG: serine/threonine protein kinase [Nannocystis sp.]|uniref:serine/threonine-protein kinase n=1 Tax=Nannocystis sp. TaxID=1962667 RepID=UPI0024263F28|nr:serine/threonine-protein kinase [Nannocystis sp.]MBK9757064.1 serine/threonine protein kinase [Nannocystis sp.]
MTASGDEAGAPRRPPPGDAAPSTTSRSSPAEIEATRVDTDAQPLPGDSLPTTPRRALLGRYSLLRKLGEGGMGVVYSAYDEELDRRIAIKLLRPRTSPDGGASSDRMLREAQLMAKLSHPNVVQVYDVGVLSEQVFLAMEFVQGSTLREWIHGTPEEPRPTPRPLPEILAMYRQAGLGLAAAHAAGLVHRDFKPDNVVVGTDGRARVLDFGLARSDAHPDDATLTSERSDVHPLESSRSARRSRPTDRPPTAAGSLLGTPAYMSPEQHLRVAVDARSDQFSFCVALYEALYGERPFAGKTHLELRTSILTSAIRDPPPRRKVPAWLRKVLLRGLRVTPDERFPDMHALLAALAADPGRARQRWLAGLALVALALATGVALAERRNAEAELCRGADHLLAGVWDDARADVVQTALAATGLAYARDTWPRVHEQLDLFARTWRAMHVEVCEATNLHHTQSEALMDLRMACLADSRAELRAVVDVLAEADASIAERAVQTASNLRPLARCAELDIQDPRLAPRDPATATALRELQALLAQVRAEDDAGRYTRGLELAHNAVATADRSGHAPARADAIFHRGRLEESSADFTAAERSYEAAYYLADAIGEDHVRIEAALRLIDLVGERLGRDHDGMQWAHQAEALLHRLGDPPALEAQLRARLGVVHTRYARYSEALTAIQRSIDLSPASSGPRLAMYQRHLGNVHYRRGRHAEAQVAYERAVELGEAALGPDHPDIARTISNLGEVHRIQGHLVEAERCFRRSIAIWERAFGPHHSLLAPPVNGLGTLAYARGDLLAAADYFERVRALLERSSGPDHPDVGSVTGNLAEVHLRQGNLAESRRYSERALQILEHALGPEHDSLADVLSNLARALVLQGQLPEAAAHYQRAIAILERAHGPDFPGLSKPLTGQGLLALASAQPTRAIAPLERALTLASAQDPSELAELRLALARALWDSKNDRPRARALVELARAELLPAPANPARTRITAELGAWLIDHPPP